LSKSKLLEPEPSIQHSMLTSTALHVALIIILFFTLPPQIEAPHLKNVPERFARLLIEKPKPTPAPTPKPPEPPKPIVKKEPPKKIQKIVKPQPKVFVQPKVLAKTNKYPMVVKQPVPKAPPPVKVESLGALAALGAVSDKAPSNVVTNININKDAGGLPSKAVNTGGIAGALPSSSGTLAAGGSGNVKTKGKGFGTGTGYGIQGLKGSAGGRAVVGAIVGEPKLAASGKPEGLTRAQVMAVVQKYLGEVQHCYERSLLSDPGIAGRMEFEWDISAGGQVTAVRVRRSTVNNGDALGECVKGVFSSMKFPSAKNGMTTTPNIGFPFGRM
jgi:outer membrane biosynthesis protein TonB